MPFDIEESMNNERLINTLKRHEGFRQRPYQDTMNILTVGYGRNLEINGISEKEAEYLLIQDITRISHEIWDVLPIFDQLCSPRQEVLVNMVYNLGMDGLLNFRKMLAALANGLYTLAADEMLHSLWSRQVGSRSFELAKVMELGVWEKSN